jgi:hypothetical protein
MVPYTIKRSKEKIMVYCYKIVLETFLLGGSMSVRFLTGGGENVCPSHAEVIQWWRMITLLIMQLL